MGNNVLNSSNSIIQWFFDDFRENKKKFVEGQMEYYEFKRKQQNLIQVFMDLWNSFEEIWKITLNQILDLMYNIDDFVDKTPIQTLLDSWNSQVLTIIEDIISTRQKIIDWWENEHLNLKFATHIYDLHEITWLGLSDLDNEWLLPTEKQIKSKALPIDKWRSL